MGERGGRMERERGGGDNRENGRGIEEGAIALFLLD